MFYTNNNKKRGTILVNLQTSTYNIHVIRKRFCSSGSKIGKEVCTPEIFEVVTDIQKVKLLHECCGIDLYLLSQLVVLGVDPILEKTRFVLELRLFGIHVPFRESQV